MAVIPKQLSAFPITPCDARGRLDAQALRRILAPLVAARVDSVGLLGSTGSYPYLTRAERRRTIEVATEAVDGVVPLIVGVGALRTDEAIALAQDAKAAGATAGLLAPVSYTPLTDDEVFTHFVAVAEASRLPLHIYDNPGTTHFSFTPALIGRLSRVPGIVALKSPAPEADVATIHLETLRGVLPTGFEVGCSVDWNAGEALLAGADTWYSVAAGVFPERCVALVRSIERDPGEARRLNAWFAPLWSLFRRFSSLRTVYSITHILGLCHAAPPRPILPLRREDQAGVKETLRSMGLL